MDKKTISIDPSLRSTGVFLGGELYTIASAQKVPALAAKENLYNQLNDLIRMERPRICLIEDYSYGKAGMSASLTALAEIRGIISAICFEWNCRMVAVNIQLWKSITGFKYPKKTAGDKREYCRLAEDMAGMGFASPDEVDAFMIYLAVDKLLECGGKTAAQRKLIEEVRR